MATYEIVMIFEADNEDQATEIAVERLQRRDGYEIEIVHE